MIVIGYDLVSYLLHYSSARCVTFKELFVCKSNNKTGDFDMNLPDFFSISYKFFRKSGFIRAHHRTKGFWTNVCRLSHKRRKGLCLTPKQQFRLMMQGPFLLCLCQRGAFTGSQTISFSLFLWAVSGKPCLTARSINGTSRYARQANREEWFYMSDRTRSARHIKSYFLAGGLPGFTLPAMSLFFLLGISFFHRFLFWSFPV